MFIQQKISYMISTYKITNITKRNEPYHHDQRLPWLSFQDALAVVQFAVWCFAVIIVAVSLGMLWHNREKHFFKNRRWYLSFAQTLILFILLLVYFVALHASFSDQTESISSLIAWQCWVAFAALLTWFLWIVTLRFHFLYFDQSYAQAVNDHEWSSQMNIRNDTTWFFDKKSTCGSLRWMFRPFLGVIIVMSVALVVCMEIAMSHRTFVLYQSVFYVEMVQIVVALGIIAMIYLKLPDESDRIFLRSELLIDAICLVSGLSIFILWLVNPIERNARIRSFVANVLYFVVSVVQSLATSWYVIWNNLSVDVERSSDMRTWNQFLDTCTAAEFREFARFLASEFAIESLAFVVEYTRFKNEFEGRILAARNGNLGRQINIPPEIIDGFDASGLNTMQAFGDDLFTRFIDPGVAPMEINISSATRKRLQTLLAPPRPTRISAVFGMAEYVGTTVGDMDDKVEKLANVIEAFDDAEEQLLRLMGDSYSRFAMYRQ